MKPKTNCNLWRVAVAYCRAGLTALVLLGSGRAVVAEEDQQLEFRVKAALLPKLAAFVEWPSSTFSNTNDPIHLVVLGAFPFGDDFEAAVKGQTANGRRFVIERVESVGALTRCHILFISPSNGQQLESVLKAVRGKPVLTIGDQSDFAAKGGVINFIKVQGKVRFEINIAAAARNELKISSKLLQLSTIVHDADRSDSGFGSPADPRENAGEIRKRPWYVSNP